MIETNGLLQLKPFRAGIDHLHYVFVLPVKRMCGEKALLEIQFQYHVG